MKEEFFRIPHYCFNTLAWISKQLYPFLPFLLSLSKRSKPSTSSIKGDVWKKTLVHSSILFTHFVPYHLFPLELCSEIFWCSVFQSSHLLKCHHRNLQLSVTICTLKIKEPKNHWLSKLHKICSVHRWSFFPPAVSLGSSILLLLAENKPIWLLS